MLSFMCRRTIRYEEQHPASRVDQHAILDQVLYDEPGVGTDQDQHHEVQDPCKTHDSSDMERLQAPSSSQACRPIANTCSWHAGAQAKRQRAADLCSGGSTSQLSCSCKPASNAEGCSKGAQRKAS